MDFPDRAFATGHDAAYYQNLLFNEANPASLASYWKEVSYGCMTVSGIVAPVVTSDHAMDWWGADGPPAAWPGPPTDSLNGMIRELAREAIQKADPTFDFAACDRNGDGIVDHVMVIHAGSGQEVSNVAGDIWSHAGYYLGQQVDGKTAGSYTMAAEDSPLGVLAHVFGHELGLQEMGQGPTPVAGPWDLMDQGCWNGSPAGSCPAHPSAWSKIRRGWLTATTVTGPTQVTVPDVESHPVVYRLEDATLKGVKEYFLVENRQQVGFDAALPGSGLLIWHVNEKAYDNSSGGPRLVAPEPAGGTLATAPFASTSFDSATSPNSNTTTGSATSVCVDGISASGPTMTATLAGSVPHLEPYAVTTSVLAVRGQLFTFRAGVRAVGGPCGDVSAWLDPAAIVAQQSPCVAGPELIGGRGNVPGHPEPNAPSSPLKKAS